MSQGIVSSGGKGTGQPIRLKMLGEHGHAHGHAHEHSLEPDDGTYQIDRAAVTHRSSAVPDAAAFEVNPRDIGKLTGQKLYVSSKTSCSSTRMSVGMYERFILAHGAIRSAQPSDADILLMDSCAATNVNEELSMKQLIESQKASKPGAKLIVSGCLAEINPTLLKSVPGTEVFSPNKSGDLARILGLDEAQASAQLGGVGLNGHFMGYGTYRPTFGDQTMFSLATTLHKINNRVRIDWLPFVDVALSASQSVNPKCYGVTISQGCMGNCTFCVTQLVKGKTRSVPMGLIVDAIRTQSEQGVKHFYLSSEDTGAYGVDIGTNIVELLKNILTIDRDFGLYVTFFDPRWIKPYGERLLPVLRDSRIKHFMMPMQSGSNTVLQRMRRGYRVEQIVPFFHKMHHSAPKVSLASGVIAGFPGETEEEFQQTRALLRSVPFDRLDVHPVLRSPRRRSRGHGSAPAAGCDQRAGQDSAQGLALRPDDGTAQRASPGMAHGPAESSAERIGRRVVSGVPRPTPSRFAGSDSRTRPSAGCRGR